MTYYSSECKNYKSTNLSIINGSVLFISYIHYFLQYKINVSSLKVGNNEYIIKQKDDKENEPYSHLKYIYIFKKGNTTSLIYFREFYLFLNKTFENVKYTSIFKIKFKISYAISKEEKGVYLDIKWFLNEKLHVNLDSFFFRKR